MPRTVRRRRRTAAALAILAVLAMSASVIASAASLGGLRTQGLGAASSEAQTMHAVTLEWAPVWAEHAWRVGSLGLSADPARGFLAGDEVKVTIARQGTTPCEVRTDVGTNAPSLSVPAQRFAEVCGTPLAYADIDGVAISVVGQDGETVVTSVGELTGSLAGFAGSVLHAGRSLALVHGPAMPRGPVGELEFRVDGADADDLAGGTVALAFDGTAGPAYTVTQQPGAEAWVRNDGPGGALLTVRADWVLLTDMDLSAVLTSRQQLTGAASTGAVTMASWLLQPSGGPVEEPPPAPVGSALEAVRLSDGIMYRYNEPWSGWQTNVLTYCHSFTITNEGSSRLTDWWVQFDSTLPPLWGADPLEPGTIEYSNIETRDYDRQTGLWTISGSSDWARTLDPGQARTYQYCARSVPTPEPDPSRFDTEVRVVSGNDWHVTFQIDVTSSSPYYVPWSVEVDLAEFVCADSLRGRTIQFSQVRATPVPGSSTRYVIAGNTQNTHLVSSAHSRSFTFANYSPGPGWQLPCPGGGVT